jgi:aminoglycoside phosphotransferase (APT) family kinase protein
MLDTHLPLEDFRERLTEYLEAAMNVPAVEVEALAEMPGGASRDNWRVKIKIDDERQQLVLRRDLATTVDEHTLTRDQEFRVMKAAFDSGVAVPRPRWYCIEPLILGARFLIMDYVEGISIGRQVVQNPELAEARRLMPEQMAEQLARIHSINAEQMKLDFLPASRPGYSPAQELLLQIRAAIVKLGVHNPVFEFGLRWAQQHAPTCEKPVVVHGDFRVGNFLVSSKGLAGIVDWEFCHIGDPLEDLAWPCLRDWRYGNGLFVLGGIAESREPFIQAYERISGRKVDRKAIDFWEVASNLRWAVLCISQANRHLSGGDPSVELASLGRRSAEMQLEMMRRIGELGFKDHA